MVMGKSVMNASHWLWNGSIDEAELQEEKSTHPNQAVVMSDVLTSAPKPMTCLPLLL